MKVRLPGLALALVCVSPCLWDRDTIDDELRGLPDALDLIVGRWHRHGAAYYRERLTRLGGDVQLTLDDYDDLAVAHERLGDHDAAIAVMERKRAALEANDDATHRYRMLANLGTFQAHAGRYEEALQTLRAAVALNPEAHFGRERFQVEAIEHRLATMREPEVWITTFVRFAGHKVKVPLRDDWSGADAVSMAMSPPDPSVVMPDPEAVYRGIAGLLRFGERDSAELYRALGEQMLSRGDLHLAWWALQRARERGHPADAQLVATLAAIERHWDSGNRAVSPRLEVPTIDDYRRVRENADRWLHRFQALEEAALARGADPHEDAVLRGLLAAADREVPREPLGSPKDKVVLLAVVGISLALLMATLLFRTRMAVESTSS